jgi:sugar lactone lactonase YvrE
VIEERSAAVCSEIVAEHGEGPVWDSHGEELLWVDIGAGRLHRGRPQPDGVVHLGTLEIGVALGAVAPAQDGGWILAAGLGFAHAARDGRLTWLAEPEAGRPELRMNDGACDPRGRFWAGSMAYAETPGAGTLYRLDPDGSVRPMVRGATISNGLGWSEDGTTLWYADSSTGVDTFAFDLAAGTATNRRKVIRIDPDDGVPDGLTVDAEDHVWLAIWDGGEVRRYTPAGDLVMRVRLPVSRPTSCCFGGADLATLFITTARLGLTDDQLRGQPNAGHLFAADVGVRGVASPRFAGPARRVSPPGRSS